MRTQITTPVQVFVLIIRAAAGGKIPFFQHQANLILSRRAELRPKM